MKVAVYPGSFDPLTNGHLDIVTRASRLFDRLLVSVIMNPGKSPLFSLEERLAMLNAALKPFRNVAIDSFSGLLVDYVRRHKATAIVRGLRAVSDFEYEFQMALMNRTLLPEAETMFLMTSHQFAYLSSSLIKEVAGHGGGIRGLVPPMVEEELKKKFSASRKGARRSKRVPRRNPPAVI